jgi:chromosomal replication initiator protein
MPDLGTRILPLWAARGGARSKHEMAEQQQFNTWVRPLQAGETGGLRAARPQPLRGRVDRPEPRRPHRQTLLTPKRAGALPSGMSTSDRAHRWPAPAPAAAAAPATAAGASARNDARWPAGIGSIPICTFDTFRRGQEQPLCQGRAPSRSPRIPVSAYNPLFIYGGVGLGKTHLMHAIGHRDPGARPGRAASPTCTPSASSATWSTRCSATPIERVQARTTATLDALLIDDIQFFAGKDRSQEEFFHTFNALLEGQHADHPDLRPLPEGSRRARGAAQLAASAGA